MSKFDFLTLKERLKLKSDVFYEFLGVHFVYVVYRTQTSRININKDIAIFNFLNPWGHTPGGEVGPLLHLSVSFVQL